MGPLCFPLYSFKYIFRTYVIVGNITWFVFLFFRFWYFYGFYFQFQCLPAISWLLLFSLVVFLLMILMQMNMCMATQPATHTKDGELFFFFSFHICIIITLVCVRLCCTKENWSFIRKYCLVTQKAGRSLCCNTHYGGGGKAGKFKTTKPMCDVKRKRKSAIVRLAYWIVKETVYLLITDKLKRKLCVWLVRKSMRQR